MPASTLAARAMPYRWAKNHTLRRVYTLTLTLGFALLTALCAQFSIYLDFTPVPITGQTFAVLLSGATLGATAGAGSQLLYWVMGAAGLPFYADGNGGWEVATGATAGYFLGFIVAAYLIGHLAQQKQDRRILTSLGVFLTGTFTIYFFGALGLMRAPFDFSLAEAVEKGVAPFLIGDAIKLLLAAGLLPAAWKLLGDPTAKPPTYR